MKTTTLLLTCLVLLTSSAGCIENMRDLKEVLGATDEAPAATTETVKPAATPPTNATRDTKPPVARISIFGGNGAMLFKSTFQADDPADIVFVPENSKVSLLASDSEALETGATLASFAWSLAGKPLATGAKAEAEIGAAGLYPIVLTVTDSHGKSDNQTVKLAVAPQPYDVVITFLTDPVAGAEGEGLSAISAFSIVADAEQPAKVQKVVVSAVPDLTLDAILRVRTAEGESLGEADEAGATDLDQAETLTLGALPLGDYEVEIAPFAGIDADGVEITITITLLPIIEGLEDAGDGHGGHAH